MTIPDKTLTRLRGIRVFRDIMETGEEAFEALLDQGTLETWQPNDTIIHANFPKSYFYIVVRGNLKVQPVDAIGEKLGKHTLVHAGEFLGELSMLLNETSTAEVAVPAIEKEAITFKLPFDKVANIQDHSSISLPVKIQLYRHIVLLLRWRNDVYRMHFPNNELSTARYTVGPFSGKTGTQEELNHLYELAVYLAKRLKNLNLKLGAALFSQGNQ